MSIRMNKLRALLKKDFKDLMKNGNCLLMVALPLLFTLLYTNMDLGGEGLPAAFVLMLCLLMNLSLMPISVMAMVIAEEKEKNTLRTLMLSNVSAGEFLLSKSIVIFVISEIVSVLIYLITGVDSVNPVSFALATSATCVCMLLFGALVGILSKNQMTSGSLSAPLALLMLMPAIFAEMNETFAKIAQFMPTRAMVELLMSNEKTLLNIGILLIWIVLAAALFTLTYRKKRLD